MSQKQNLECAKESRGDIDIEEGFDIINKIEKENSLHFLDEEIRKEINYSNKLDQKIESIYNNEKKFFLWLVIIFVIVFIYCYKHNENVLNKYL